MPEVVKPAVGNAGPLAGPPKAMVDAIIGAAIPIPKQVRAVDISGKTAENLKQRRVYRDNPPLVMRVHFD
jgi:hypothetical protein